MASDRGRAGFRRRNNSGRHIGGGSRFRKGSNELNRNRNDGRPGPRFRNRLDRDNDQGTRRIRGRRIIRKRNQKPLPKDKDQLKNQMDRQMRQYWVKSGSSKGKQEAKKDATLASKKMNEQMDQYWKKAKEKKEQVVEPAAQKKQPPA